MKEARIRAVIFDFGSVLTLPQDEARIEEMRRLAGLDSERFAESYRAHRFDYDRGSIDSAAYWKGVLRAGGVSQERIDALNGEFVGEMTELDVQSWTVLRHPMIEWARRLKEADFKTAILSNMPYDHARYIEGEFDWLELFDVKVFSYAVRLAKPEPAIYEECLNRLAVPAGESLFIDDVERNVAAAKAAGINAVLFRNPADLAEHLREFPDLPIPQV